MRLLTRAIVAALLITLATSAATPRPAFAGTIGFRVNATVTAAAEIQVELSIDHTGNEAAINVQPVVELEGQSVAGSMLATMAPETTETWHVSLKREDLVEGSYIAIIRVRYADTNGYPFEILATANVKIGNPKTLARIRGNMKTAAIPENGSALSTLTVEASKNRAGKVDVQIVVPSGLQLSRDSIRLDMSKDLKKEVQLTVTNKSLLLGTSVNIFALVSNRDGATRQTDLIRGNVRISRAIERLTTRLLLQVSALLTVLLITLESLSRWRNP